MKSGQLSEMFLTISGIAIIILAGIVSASVMNQQQCPGSPWAGVEQALGTNGTVKPDGVFYVELPRDDIQVSIGDVRLARPLVLDSFVAFMDMGSQGSMVMGDLVLQPQELLAVQTSLLQGGLEITAVHNTLVGETPQVYDVHFGSTGDPVKIAGIIRSALESANVRYLTSEVPGNISASPVDTRDIDAAMGIKGTYEDGVVQYSVPRADRITENGMELPPSMDVATTIKLQPLSGDRVAAAGEYVLLAEEVGPVMKALNRNGITITATHTHMLGEKPKLYYLHVWASGDTIAVAKGLREAINRTNAKK